MTDAKGMNVHEALEEVRAQKEKLEDEVCIKTDLCNNLKRAQGELITKLHEAKLQSEKQTLELSAKSEELSTLSQLHQDLKSSFQEKESSFKHLNSAIEKLRYEYGEKIQKFEGETKELVSALDEAKTISQFLKSKVDSSNVEIEDLKRVLSLNDKKLLEISDKARTTKDLTQRDEVISKLEEQHRDVQDQLKWKNEQFQHLEEAHTKLQDSFKSSKIEWEKDKSCLVNDLCSVQTSLDSQTRICENLQTQLRICNQALAHEESSKKRLEAEISEYKSRFDDIFSECHEAKMTIEKLSHKRDEDVAELRDLLAAKESLSKEMGYKMQHLEQENKDLIASVKELQESQIRNCGNTGTVKKLQKKYNQLEQVHKKCSEKLKQEVEWKADLEKLRKEVDSYSTKLRDNSEEIMQLQDELKSCHCLLEVQKEEASMVVFLLKTQFSEIYRKMEREKVELFDEQIRVLENSQTHDEKDGSDVLSQKLVELENKISGLREKVKVKDESLLKVSQRAEELEDLLRVNKLETENLIKQFGDERTHLETKLFGLCEKVKVKDEILLKSTQRVEELEDLLRVNRLETENLMKQFGDERTCLETELSGLCEKVKVKDENLLKSTQRIEELEDLLRSNRLETENLMDQFGDEKTRLETEVSGLRETFKVKDETLLKSTQRAEELEGLLCVNKLETKNLMKQFGDERRCLEDEVSGLCEKLKVKDETLLKSTQRAEELEDLLRFSKLETENLMKQFGDERRCLEDELSGLRETVKIKDETLLKSTQRAEELEDLLCVKKLETENLMKQFGEERRCLEDEVSGLCEKLRVKDETLLKSTQRAAELEDLLRFSKLETENLMKQFGDERGHLEDEVSGLCEKLKVKDESLLKSTQRAAELEDLQRFSKLETDNLMKQFEDERRCLEDEVCGLCEKLKVKDETLLKSTQRAEELEDLLRVNKLEAENLRKQFGDERICLEDEVSGLCEKLKVKDETLLKSTQRAEELEDLLRVSKLETENLMKQFEDERRCLEDEVSGLCEKLKVKDESLLKSTQRIDELEDFLHINKLETENLMKQFGDERRCLEDELSGFREKLKVQDETLLNSTQRAEELEDLLRVSKLETENLMKQFGDERRHLEDEVFGLCEKLKVKDETLLKSTQRAEELEDLLRVNKLETENLIKHFGDERTRLETELSGFCEKLKVKDETLLKSTQRAEELEDLLRVNKLEAENLRKQFGDKRRCLEDEVSGLCEKLKVKDETLLKSTQRAEELEDLLRHKNTETENLPRLENEISSLCEKLKGKDESLLKSTQRTKELEDLLCINESETEKLMKQFGDEKNRLEDRVNRLEAQNQALHEDIEKISSYKDDLLIQMEMASKKMEEYFQDVELTRMLENILQKC